MQGRLSINFKRLPVPQLLSRVFTWLKVASRTLTGMDRNETLLQDDKETLLQDGR